MQVVGILLGVPRLAEIMMAIAAESSQTTSQKSHLKRPCRLISFSYRSIADASGPDDHVEWIITSDQHVTSIYETSTRQARNHSK